MNKISIYKEYCTGCGLCHSVYGVKFIEDLRGFEYPDLHENDLEFCQNVCPAGGHLKCSEESSTWGFVSSAYIGWATDDNIRRKASSGGALSALCCYLLNEGIVDGIIQTTV